MAIAKAVRKISTQVRFLSVLVKPSNRSDDFVSLLVASAIRVVNRKAKMVFVSVLSTCICGELLLPNPIALMISVSDSFCISSMYRS